MANKKAEILTMDGQVVSPITLATNVLLEDGRTAQDLLDSRDESMFTPTITTSSSISKVGQGDNVDFSENIIDGAYKSCVLKGKTLVNHNAEGNNRNEYACMPSLEGSNLTVNGTVESKVKSAILKGQTLVNVSKPAFNNGKINEQYSLIGQITDMVKVNNTYYFKIFNKTNTALKCYISGQVATDLFSFNINANSFFSGTFTTKNEFTGNAWLVNDENQTVKQDVDIILIDYQEGMENWDIPYFEGMQSVKMPVLKSVGKNLFNLNDVTLNNRTGIFNTSLIDNGVKVDIITSGSWHEYISGSFIPVKGNTKYKQYYENTGVLSDFKNFDPVIIELDKNKNAINRLYGEDTKKTFTTSQKTCFIKLDFRFRDTTPTGVGYIKNIQLEEATESTPYEPYKTNILTVNEPVELRGIGEVRDTLDCLTGKATERIGEIMLDGSEGVWSKHSGLSTDEYDVYWTSNGFIPSVGKKMLSDKLGYSNPTTPNTFRINDSGGLFIGVSKGVNIRDYLSQNTPKIQYDLTEPTIKTVDLSILDQDNQPTTQLNSFANGYIQVSSQGLIPSVDYEVPTSNSYHVDLMKPNTQYTMKNMQGTFTIDNIQYNASTNGTFTSPSALSNRLMITNMVQTQPMLLEGDMTSKEVPYVEGIKSTFDGVVKVEIYSVGENLFDFTNSGLRDESTYDKGMNGYGFWSFAVQLQPNKEVTISRKNSDGYNLGLNLKIHNENTYNGGNWIIANHAQNENKSSTTLTTNSDGYIWFIFSNNFNKINQILDICEYIKIEYGRVATPYEPYKSNTTSFQLPHPLRSLPNGVRDEIVLDRVNHKAKFIQRVGEDLTQLDTPIVTEVNLEGYPYVYKGGHIFLNTEIAPATEATYSINQAHQIESSNEDILRHQNEINHLYELIAQYVQVQYEAELIDIALQG